jgi:two-component system nitrogen regulation response regulator GlnG
MARGRPEDESTIRPRAVAGAGQTARSIWLTVLWHPQLERVGDVAPLASKLSRLEPDFGAPGAAVRAPLADPRISRTPVALSQVAGGLSIAGSEVVVDGAPVDGDTVVTDEQLARGAVVELGAHVALLVQHRAPPRAAGGDLLVGASEAIAELRDEIARVAPLDVPVLIAGETGAGKEHAARALHAGSRRAAGPFVAINIATLAPGVAAGQLFGHVRGAFTGADRAHVGLFEQAHGGTLFLDEIADAPPEVQAMMLRVLDAGEILPVGADSPRKVDVRVLAATDADLEADVATGEFRSQLYHRLAGYRLAVPPLRARPDDIGRLLARFATAALGGEPPALGRDAQPWLPAAALRGYVVHAWPGNVRELANLARHLAVIGRTAPIALADALAPLGRPAEEPAPAPARERELDDAQLIAALAAHRWKTGATARALGISRTTLYALIDRCPQIRKAKDLGRDEIIACRDAARGDLDEMSERLQVSKRGLQLRMRELGLP